MLTAQDEDEEAGLIPARYYEDLAGQVCLIIDSTVVMQHQPTGIDEVEVRDDIYVNVVPFNEYISQPGLAEYESCGSVCLNSCATAFRPEAGGLPFDEDSRIYDWPVVQDQPETSLSRGTGVVVGRNLVLTSYHVVKNLDEREVRGLACLFGLHDVSSFWEYHDLDHPKEQYYRVDYVAWKDEDADLAILGLDRCFEGNYDDIQILRKSATQVHADLKERSLFSLGHPSGMAIVMATDGKLSPQQTVSYDARCELPYYTNTLYNDLDLMEGCSGSPIFVKPTSVSDPLCNTVVAVHAEGIGATCRSGGKLKETSLPSGKFCAGCRTLGSVPSGFDLDDLELWGCPDVKLVGAPAHKPPPDYTPKCYITVYIPGLANKVYGITGENVVNELTVQRIYGQSHYTFRAYKGANYSVYLVDLKTGKRVSLIASGKANC